MIIPLKNKMVTKRKGVNEDIEMSSTEKVKEKKMGWSRGKMNKTTKNVNVETGTWSETEVSQPPRRLPRHRSSAPEDLDVLQEAEEVDGDDDEDEIPVSQHPTGA